MSDSLESHFLELKQRLIKSLIFFVVAFCCLYPFNNTFFNLLSDYIFIIPDFELIAVEVASPFLVPLRLTAFLALLLSMPFLIFQLFMFMAPGLYENEKKIVLSRSALGTFLFFAGVMFCTAVVLPNVFNFFQTIGPDSINISTDISKFLSFVLGLSIAFGFGFQIPIIINAIISLGVATKKDLKNLRGIFLVICFTFGMIFTPPDVISQFLLAVPMYLLFELGLIFSNDEKT